MENRNRESAKWSQKMLSDSQKIVKICYIFVKENHTLIAELPSGERIWKPMQQKLQRTDLDWHDFKKLKLGSARLGSSVEKRFDGSGLLNPTFRNASIKLRSVLLHNLSGISRRYLVNAIFSTPHHVMEPKGNSAERSRLHPTRLWDPPSIHAPSSFQWEVPFNILKLWQKISPVRSGISIFRANHGPWGFKR